MLPHVLEAWLNGDSGPLMAAGLGAMLNGAWDALKDEFTKPWDDFKKELMDPYKDLARDLVDKFVAPGLERAVEDVRRLADMVKTQGETVFNEIGQTINDALDTGVVPPQTDGGLGETHDNFTPDGEIPMDVGALPGFGSEGGGTDRDTSGDPGGYGGSGGSSGGGSSPTPLGGTGSSPPTGGGSETTPPTAADLGLDPDSGAYIEYQPNQGQVQITYPDGTTEVRPWPQQ